MIFTDGCESLQEHMIKVADASEKYGLKLKTNKTKFMVIKQEAITSGQLVVHNK